MSPARRRDRFLTRFVDAFWLGTVGAVVGSSLIGPDLLPTAGVGGAVALGTVVGPGLLERRTRPRRRSLTREILQAAALILLPLGAVAAVLLWRDLSRTFLLAVLAVLALRSVASAAFDAAHHHRLGHQASRDELTGLLNRRGILDALEAGPTAAAEAGGTTAVLLLDLDGFKGINDLHGHHAGDQVLVTVARRLMAIVPETDAVGRLGGDEFVVVTRGGDPHRLAGEVRASIVEPLDWQRFALKVGCSIGVCRDGFDGVELSGDRVLDRADQALYRAKDLGGNVVVDVDLDEPVGGADEPASRPAKRHAAKRARLGVG